MLVNGHFNNHVEGHEFPGWNLLLLHNMRYIFRSLDEI